MQHERAGQDDVVQEDSPLVHASVAVGVGKDDDGAFRLIFGGAVEVLHVAGHLDDPQAAVGTELQDGRMTHEGLGGDELDAVAGRDGEGLERLLRGQRRRRRDEVRGDDRRLHHAGLVRLVADLGDERQAGQQEAADGWGETGHGSVTHVGGRGCTVNAPGRISGLKACKNRPQRTSIASP